MKKVSKFLNIVLRPLDNLCNLHCKYCNVQLQSELNKSPNFSFNSKSLAWEWLPLLIKQLNFLPELRTVVFTWHGGEPLLLPKILFEKAVYWQSKYLRKNLQWSNVIQTNGLLLNDKYADFLTNLGIHIGISIDGPKYKHNQFRFTSFKEFKILMNNIYSLRTLKIPYSLSMVVHENNYQDAKGIMNFLLEMKPQNGVGLPPRFTNEDSFLDPCCYRDFLIQLFEAWWPYCPVHISIFENIIDGLEQKAPSLCYLIGRCDGFISIDSQGNVYSTCEINYNLKIGNILEEPLEDLILRHNQKIAECLGKIENKRLFEILGLNIRYIYFQAKGCPNRLVKGEDPYMPAFAEVIHYIDKAVNGMKV